MTPSCSATDRPQDVAVGRAFAAALARRDFDEVAALLHPDVEFRALTPRRTFEPASVEEIVGVVRLWFGTADVEQVLAIDSDVVGDRLRVGYCFRGIRDGAPFVIEQQAYYEVREGRIAWVRLVCSGFRPPT